MTSLRTGVDIIEIERFDAIEAKIRQRFLNRVFTPQELSDCAGVSSRLAGRFAAKEAVAKALGCGIGPVGWREIEIVPGGEGQPMLKLHGKAEQIAARQGLTGWSISISHNHSQAVAFAAALQVKL